MAQRVARDGACRTRAARARPGCLVLSLIALGWVQPAAAQRLAAVCPGTLVRITTDGGEHLVGPLAEVRGDSIHLSTMASQPARAVALAGVRAIAYQDGKDFHGRTGAVIGAGVGALIGLLSSFSADGDYALTPRQAMTLFGVIGTGIGGFIGLASGTPHWVDASARIGQRRPEGQASRVSLLQVRF